MKMSEKNSKDDGMRNGTKRKTFKDVSNADNKDEKPVSSITPMNT